MGSIVYDTFSSFSTSETIFDHYRAYIMSCMTGAGVGTIIMGILCMYSTAEYFPIGVVIADYVVYAMIGMIVDPDTLSMLLMTAAHRRDKYGS
ncbi:hypothetical protein V1507DRAFT_266146 [Lipomyces tetrasporus]